MSHFTTLVIIPENVIRSLLDSGIVEMNEQLAFALVASQLEEYCEFDDTQNELAKNPYCEFRIHKYDYEVMPWIKRMLVRDRVEVKKREPEDWFVKMVENHEKLWDKFKNGEMTEEEFKEEFIDKYAGWVKQKVDGGYAWGYYWNNNAKWDWFSVGGRWRGFFIAKPDAEICLVGDAGVGGNDPENDADIIFKKDIDFERMKKEKMEQGLKDWEEYKELQNKDKKKGCDENGCGSFGKFLFTPKGLSKEEFLKDYNLATFAVVKNGKWYEKGDMGWWGIVTDEKEVCSWKAEWKQLVESADENDLFILVDCHI
jgi:hypothetical protein